MDVLLPFAKHLETNQIVSVDEVPRGNACGCVCLFCGVLMQARKGGEKREHFAHQPREVDEDNLCPASFKRCFFWMARRILSEAHEITLPTYELHLANRPYKIYHRHIITESQLLKYDSVEFPDNQESLEHDTAFLMVGNHKLALTLIFGQEEHHRHYSFEEERIAELVINVDRFEALYKEVKKDFRSLMETRLLSELEGKRWVYHPREKKYQLRFNDEVEAVWGKEQAEKKRKEEIITTMKLRKAKRELAEKAVAKTQMKTSTQPSPPHHAPKIHKERLHELVTIVMSLKAQGVIEGYMCEHCKVMYKEEPNKCEHCGDDTFQRETLTDDYCKHLDKKYWCWSFPEQSLKVAPHLKKD